MTVRDGVRERGSFGGRARLGVDPGNEKRDPTVRVSFAILPAVLPSMLMRASVVLVLPVSPSPRKTRARESLRAPYLMHARRKLITSAPPSSATSEGGAYKRRQPAHSRRCRVLMSQSSFNGSWSIFLLNLRLF